jgi:hypothetical protein
MFHGCLIRQVQGQYSLTVTAVQWEVTGLPSESGEEAPEVLGAGRACTKMSGDPGSASWRVATRQGHFGVGVQSLHGHIASGVPRVGLEQKPESRPIVHMDPLLWA